MDAFFEVPDQPDPGRLSSPEPPPWVEPPRDLIAGLVPERRVLAKTDWLTLLLTHIDAFPTGASLRLRAMARWSADMSEDDWHKMSDSVLGGRRHHGQAGVADDFLRVGVEFADGRKATNLDHTLGRRPEAGDPPEPSLIEHGMGSTGTDRYFAQGRSLWLWPLPPPEPFDLVVEWPAFGIPVTRTALDGAAIVAAAHGAEPAWLESRG